MAGAQSLEELARPEYWEARYANPDEPATYEWFKSFEHLRPLLEERLPPPALHEGGVEDAGPRILHPGCGNSMLPIHLYEMGYHLQSCVDFSAGVVANMAARTAASMPGLRWLVGDIRDMTATPLLAHSQDAIVDKGTMDAMIHGSPWDPPDEVKRDVDAYMSEMARLLVPSGVFICISFRQPHFVKPLLLVHDRWDLEVVEIQDDADSFSYFAYIMKSKARA